MFAKARAAEAVEVLTAPKVKEDEAQPEEPQDEHQLIVFLVAAALLESQF